jgi:hypothetical protein
MRPTDHPGGVPVKRYGSISPVDGKGGVGPEVKMRLIWPAQPDIWGRELAQSAALKLKKEPPYLSGRRQKGSKTP